KKINVLFVRLAFLVQMLNFRTIFCIMHNVKYKRSAGFGAIHCPPTAKFIMDKNFNFSSSARITLIQCWQFVVYSFSLIFCRFVLSNSIFKSSFITFSLLSLYERKNLLSVISMKEV